MAYQIKKSNVVKETLELLDANGNVVETIAVNIDINKTAMQINKSRNNIIRAKNNFDKANEEDSEELNKQLGNAVLELFTLLFGDDGTQRICGFYDNNYTSMINDVFPFIADVILPAMEDASIAERDKIAKNFNISKKMRKRYHI